MEREFPENGETSSLGVLRRCEVAGQPGIPSFFFPLGMLANQRAPLAGPHQRRKRRPPVTPVELRRRRRRAAATKGPVQVCWGTSSNQHSAPAISESESGPPHRPPIDRHARARPLTNFLAGVTTSSGRGALFSPLTLASPARQCNLDRRHFIPGSRTSEWERKAPLAVCRCMLSTKRTRGSVAHTYIRFTEYIEKSTNLDGLLSSDSSH